MPAKPTLIEFPADDPERARRFWSGLLGSELADRTESQGSGWQTDGDAAAVGVHERGRGPGDTASLPYFTVDDLPAALEAGPAPRWQRDPPGRAVCDLP